MKHYMKTEKNCWSCAYSFEDGVHECRCMWIVPAILRPEAFSKRKPCCPCTRIFCLTGPLLLELPALPYRLREFLFQLPTLNICYNLLSSTLHPFSPPGIYSWLCHCQDGVIFGTDRSKHHAYWLLIIKSGFAYLLTHGLLIADRESLNAHIYAAN